MLEAMGYTRISEETEGNPSLSPDVQEQEIRDYCRMKRLNLVDVVCDRGVSGGTEIGSRSGGAKLLEFALTPGRWIVVARQDRLFRDSADAVSTMKIWQRNDVTCVILAEGLELATPAGRFGFTIMAAMAQYEREIIGIRTATVMRAMKARGERVSGTFHYGWRAGPDGLAVPDEQEQANIRLMKSLRTRGLTDVQIAARMRELQRRTKTGKEWRHGTVSRILEREGAGKMAPPVYDSPRVGLDKITMADAEEFDQAISGDRNRTDS